MLRCSPLVLAALVGLLALPAGAAPLQPEDRRAHAEAAAAVREARTRKHRANWRVELPTEATTVPSRYRVTLAANYVDHAPSVWVMTVERDGDRARAEWVDSSGVRRGELPVVALDEWLRTTQHLQRATQTWRGGGVGLTGFKSASHVSYRSITARSVDPTAPFELVLRREAPIHTALDESSNVERFAHTWSVHALERLFHVHLGASTRVTVDEALRRELLARLTGLPVLHSRPGDDKDPDRDRARAEAVIYGHLLAQWQYRPAIEAVRTHGFPASARLLEVVTSPVAQRSAGLGEMLCGEYGLHKLALPAVRELPDKGEKPLLAALRCQTSEHLLADLVGAVERLPASASAAVVKALRELQGKLPAERVRIAIDRALLLRERDEPARTRLFAVADVPLWPTEYTMGDAQRLALAALRAEALADAARRPAVVAVIRRVLASIPAHAHETYSGMDTLVHDLGELGGKDDLPVLHELLKTQRGSVVVTLIEAIARHDVAAAVQAARAEVARYARGEAGASYSWNVASYHALLLRADARAAAPGLRAALQRMRGDSVGVDELDRRGQAAVIGYLSARSEAVRVEQVHAYVVASGKLGEALEATLRARHTLDDAALEQAVADHEKAWYQLRTPW